ncbi:MULTISPECIES: signal recognition particle-docking protein FtsY [Desulfococcus]|jgi:fused signal recognition particle receptor|uniref:Signal recognition particle receptor FtsY n=1 Tax=Desulfococcus multivorans DSM 2059 TaxID=1121405 RepID=S7TKC2_DESML|nr:signal recognition particle-docking protein FtsY [Desulfococcus multivorans]AOY58004.1 FtsY: cell division protein [Desulfococcus multivorans]EPR37291.1 cell division transporter substrate-binding protein FtsY [Desulfococcus multivorans DSM 2059]MDX9819014.1 signal recognition particle-docking protein FtsY [Desulfococcus multivorans]SJZ70118.1 signal recognition particle-docking protein FtsY [Desulfococcus multivorans DSM 2059]
MGWFKKKNKQDQKDETTSRPVEGQADEIENRHSRADVSSPDHRDCDPSDEDAGRKKSKGFFRQLKRGLSKTRDVLTTDIDELFRGRKKLDADLLEEIEELLITSDMGVETTMTLIDRISKKSGGISNAKELKAVLKAEVCALMAKPAPATASPRKPHVIMVVGVNGVGKTTTIGKLAARFAGEGKGVIIGAADTFRAAAVEQLTIWAERAGVDIVKHRDNADPAAVAFDSVEAATARGKDIVIIDTAGRLHTKVNLMEELKKIKRAVAKKLPDAPHDIYLVIDATTGQNALSQAKLFNDSMGITGLILTKLDGTAKGGVVIGICNTLDIPLTYIGVGEGVDDLQKFDPEQYAEALFS